MRHWTPLAAAILIALGAPAAHAAPATPKPASPKPAAPSSAGFVATVDGVAVTKADFDRTVAMLKRRYQARMGIDFASPAGKDMETELKKRLLESLVERQVILNEAARRKIVVTPAQVDAKIAELKAQTGGDKAFQDALAQEAMTVDDLRHEIQTGLTMQALAEALTSGLKVSEAEVKAYYDSHSEEFDRPEEVHVRHILVKDKAKAEKLLAQLKGGADFAAVAKEHSEDPGSKEDGGDLGFFGRGRMVQPFEEAAFKLKPGELSGLVETQFGFHILQGLEHRAARRVSLEEARGELETKLKQDARAKAVGEWLSGAKQKAKVVYAPGYAPAPTPTLQPTPKPSPSRK
jgi:parvulin-like peptidyl-prolyl isomerase